jgi:hypothetical protein
VRFASRIPARFLTDIPRDCDGDRYSDEDGRYPIPLQPAAPIDRLIDDVRGFGVVVPKRHDRGYLQDEMLCRGAYRRWRGPRFC